MPHNSTITEESSGRISNVFFPYGMLITDGTTPSATDAKNTYFNYMGVAGIPARYADIMVRMNNASNVLAGTVSWAEFGIFSGRFSFMGNATLTKLGVVDASKHLYYTSGQFDGAQQKDQKTITVPLDIPIRPGDWIWFGYGISASTMPQFDGIGSASSSRGGHMNSVFLGTSQALSAVKPSTLTGPFSTSGLTNTAGTSLIAAVVRIY